LGDGVDLVDDHRLDPGEDLTGLRAQDQVERLRGRDQDVGRIAAHGLALALRRIAGTEAGADPFCADSLQRRAQVALDVIGERLERGDVDDPDPGAQPLRLAGEPIDPPQERGQGLARAGRGADQRICAGRDRRPPLRLGRRRSLE
jgi:hypothetical protein